ncbi:DUF948 domain-containing protein [Peribacillus cavernae]|uniref:DUF948 domain-containing protein n=1 Tax=Peribacillus cavernae TaxID=1674310 RepID=A0A433HUF2_9BACI|nr:DUF948 domain-containing protein [Peribacillus cavernae]MDQ0220323.1 uncharacterized protein YoxC [Peribacillus cavernae]RUQ31978.1 DUF948 domain-containing protein [Peribacillus cavernae]
MEVILYLSAAIAAIAFLVLVVFLSRTLKSLQATLDSVAHTLDGLEKQMQGVTVETTTLLHKTNVLAEDLQKKSENLNSVVHAVKDVGTSIQNFNSSIQKVSNKVQAGIDNNQEKISQIVQWSNVAMEIRDKWRTRKDQNLPAVQTTSIVKTEEEPTDNLPKKRFLRSRY